MTAVSANSISVGAVLRMVKRTIVSMPLVPRSMTRQTAGAPLEMKPQRQFMHVDEGLERQLPHRVLADPGKQRVAKLIEACLLYTSPSPRDAHESRMPSSA